MEEKILHCSNGLDVWRLENSPYGGDFSPNIVYNSILSRITEFSNDLDSLVRTSNFGRYRKEGGDLETAAALSHDLRFHRLLIRDWLQKKEKVDIFAPIDFSDQSYLTKKISDESKLKIMSIALANRVPVIVCPSISATETGGESVTTRIEMPYSLIDAIDYFSDFVSSNRVIILPKSEIIDSSLSDSDNGASQMYLSSDFSDERWGAYGVNSTAISSIGYDPDRYGYFQSQKPEFQFLNPSQSSLSYVEEHAESYHRYMVAVEIFQTKLRNAKTESDVKLIFLEISEQYALLDEEYRQIQKKLSSRGVEVICGLGASALAIAVPQSADFLKFIVSSTTAYAGMRFFGEKRQGYDSLKKSPYWFPWSLSDR